MSDLLAFWESYARYMENTPRFLPKFGKSRAQEADIL